MFEHMF